MSVRVLMFQGTGSSVGKSTLICGLARALVKRGYKVRPFKPQNMSNNAAVAEDGCEIGRAQALQAFACGVKPSVDMNPILLKPLSEGGSQVIIEGKVGPVLKAREYQEQKAHYLPRVVEAFQRLARDADIVLVEGAGSASEINLRKHDIANMGFAQAIGAPVVIIGDIDRGGVIASLVGTQVVLPPSDQAHIKAFIVNRMRGDTSLFDEGNKFIARKTGWVPLGVVPFFSQLSCLPEEDSADLENYFKSYKRKRKSDRIPIKLENKRLKIKVIVPIYPTIANFDDLDPLRADENVELIPVFKNDPFPSGDVVLLLGSKATISDLCFLQEQGWDEAIREHARLHKGVLGICGGYQMLGEAIFDPDKAEGKDGKGIGLGLLPLDTRLARQKTLRYVQGSMNGDASHIVEGYEMHLGETHHKEQQKPFAFVSGRAEGIASDDGKIIGTYIHGIFGQRKTRLALLSQLAGIPLQRLISSSEERDAARDTHEDIVDETMDDWAAHCERFIDIDSLLALAAHPSVASSSSKLGR